MWSFSVESETFADGRAPPTIKSVPDAKVSRLSNVITFPELVVIITVFVFPSQSTLAPSDSEINLTGTSVLEFTICAGTSRVISFPFTFAFVLLI